MTLCMAFSRSIIFDLVVAMLLFGLLGVMFVVDDYHVVVGVLVVDIMIVSCWCLLLYFGELLWMSCYLWIVSG